MTRTSRTLFGLIVGLAGLSAVFTAGMVTGRLKLPPYLLVRDAAVEVRSFWRSLDPPQGHFSPVQPRPGPGQGDAQDRSIEELEALGYLGGTQPGRTRTGVTVHDRERAAQGFNLFSDGHGPVAVLMDMEGRVLHRWRFPFERAFPDVEPDDSVVGRTYWRRVALLEDGGLLALFEGQGLIRIDRSSRLEWAYPGRAHHDLEVLEDGTIYVLTRKAEIVESINPRRPVLHDAITELGPDGTERRRISIIRALERSPFATLLQAAGDAGDFLHTNTVRILDGRIADRIPAFAAGNALISIPMIDTVAVVDLEAERIEWALANLWDFQHDPEVLDNGNLLVFDNGGDNGKSRVLELDPATQEIEWLYSGREHDMYTRTCGTSQRLVNGNTLITESERGRAFEVTSGGEIVWELYTPHRAGDSGELIATLFELQRVDPKLVEGWLDLPARPDAGG